MGPGDRARQGERRGRTGQELANPIASLTSVPLKGSYDEGYGVGRDGHRYGLTVQPVIPISLSDDWNLISRTIVPIINQVDVIADSHQSGVGDTIQSFFFSPKAPGPFDLIWGAGPVFLLPTATDDLLGAEQYGVGPTGVLLWQEGSWTLGALANHIWANVGEDNTTPVSATLAQPFVTYAIAKGLTGSVNLEATYDWKAEEWTVPMNVSVSQVMPVFGQLMQFGLSGRYYLDAPDGGPDWGLSFTVTLLFPK